MSNKLEQLEFKLEKKYWDLETCSKSQKIEISAGFSFLENTQIFVIGKILMNPSLLLLGLNVLILTIRL